MLTVNSAKFYKDILYRSNRRGNIAGEVDFGQEYSRLEIETYPIPAQVFTLAIDYHAVGEVDGFQFIRVRRGETIVHETNPSHLRLDGTGAGNDIGMINNVESVVIPAPGLYTFDIFFNDQLLHSAPLEFTETRKPKPRKRH